MATTFSWLNQVARQTRRRATYYTGKADQCLMTRELLTSSGALVKTCSRYRMTAHDSTGANIPRTTCAQGWAFAKKFQVGVHEPVPAGIMPETIFKGIVASGYIIWRGSSPSTPQ